MISHKKFKWKKKQGAAAPKKARLASYREMFMWHDRTLKIYVLLGVFFAIANGAVFPVISLFIGDAVDNFNNPSWDPFLKIAWELKKNSREIFGSAARCERNFVYITLFWTNFKQN